MPPLRQAHVQGFYRPIIIGFIALAVAVTAGVVYASAGRTVIRITPKVTSLSSTFSVTFGPTAENDLSIVGTVTTEPLSTTVTATPAAEGAEVPAHATGTVVIKNTTNAVQPLAAGTRLQHENGVIVRTSTRLDVPAKGQIEATVVADPLGTEGNLPPGRFTIVALRPANQALIYGESTDPLSGGTVRESGSLSLETLTETSNAGEAKLRLEFGESTPGVFKALQPVSVASVPPAEQTAASYAVTVTMKGMTITYDHAVLDRLIRERLTTVLKKDQEIASIEPPTLKFESQPTAETATIIVSATGLAQISASSELLAPELFVGLDRESITKKLMGSELIQSLTVEFSPWWRSTAADNPDAITVERVLP